MLSATSGGVSIVLFVIVICVTVKIISLGLSLIFFYSYGVDKKEKDTQQSGFIRKKEGKWYSRNNTLNTNRYSN